MTAIEPILFGMTAAEATAAAGGAATAATTGLLGAGGSFTMSTALGTILTGAGAAASILGGMEQANAAKSEAELMEVQAGNERIKSMQKSTKIREQMLRDAATANAMFASRGLNLSGTPEQLVNEGMNQANQDIGIVEDEGRAAYMQSRARAKALRGSAPYSLLSGVGQAAFMAGNSQSIARMVS